MTKLEELKKAMEEVRARKEIAEERVKSADEILSLTKELWHHYYCNWERERRAEKIELVEAER